MIRLTTRSTLTDTLFPYTTLFRSCHDRQRRRIPAQGAHRLPGLQLPSSAAPAAAQAAAARPLQVRIAQGAALVWHLLPRRGNSGGRRSEEHTSELQSLMRISYAVFCLKKKKRIRPMLHHI